MLRGFAGHTVYFRGVQGVGVFKGLYSIRSGNDEISCGENGSIHKHGEVFHALWRPSERVTVLHQDKNDRLHSLSFANGRLRSVHLQKMQIKTMPQLRPPTPAKATNTTRRRR